MYKEDWRPEIGNEFIAKVDKGNRFDRYAVAVIVNDIITGHIPREILKFVYYFLKNNREVTGIVAGKRQ